MGYREEVPQDIWDALTAMAKKMDSNNIRRIRYGIDDLLSEIEQEQRDYERWGQHGLG